MFILENKPLPMDRAFTTSDGTQYPANWLRLSTIEEKQAIGITEAAPEPTYDQRFYWGPNNPKDHGQLIEQWTATIKQTAGSLLAPTDWYITRASETGVAAPQSVLDRRSLIRTLSNQKEASLAATTTTEELANYVTSSEFNVWEEQPVIVEDSIGFDSVSFTGNATSSDFGYVTSGVFSGESSDTIVLG